LRREPNLDSSRALTLVLLYRAMLGDGACRTRERAAAIIALGDSLQNLLAARGGAARCRLPESCKRKCIKMCDSAIARVESSFSK